MKCEQCEAYRTTYQSYKFANMKLREENKRLREALEFYAPYEKYEDNIPTTYGYTCEIAYDEGETARKALEESK